MKRSTLLFSIICLAAAAVVIVRTTAADAPPTTKPTTMNTSSGNTASGDTHLSDASYGIGFNMGKQLSQAPFKVDVDRLVQGLRDANAGKPSAIPEEQLRAALEKLQQDAAAGAEAKAREQGDAAVKAGDAYRAANGKKAGVVTTASGLQIETLTAGTGETPKATDKVKVHYTGTLIDGTKFDSSVDRGEPITFPLNGVIKGWGEGLQLMKVGGKARLVIPPSLGYGAEGQGPIPPNATLVFEVQLISIEK
jgi:FKBP-type peptidyl-prolyl cis-trans isomerase